MKIPLKRKQDKVATDVFTTVMQGMWFSYEYIGAHGFEKETDRK